MGKRYNIYNTPIDRLKQSIIGRVASWFGKHVPVYYREFWALRDLDLDICRGETVGIIGRNGSGKSTLLQLICGTLTPTTGTIETHGRITALLELGSGFNPEFTGRENVFLNAAILGLSRDEIEARFESIVAFADIGEFIEQPVKFYSSGMTVRLAFAVQAMVDPDILIVDEALAVGDEIFQRKCFRRLEELKQRGTTILFVSHSGQQIIQVCDRALLLEQGQRIFFSNPTSTVKAYHQIIFAPVQKLPSIVNELKIKDRESSNQALETKTFAADVNILSPEIISKNDFFDSNLISNIAQILPENGARIETIRILNSSGGEVNNLLFGHEYFIEVISVFFADVRDVRFTVHIHTLNGLNIFVFGYPSLVGYLKEICKNQYYRLTCKIRVTLIPNIYFISAEIWSNDRVLHQVRDFVVFRVLERPEKNTDGLVDLAIEKITLETTS
ncbi:MAG: ABC transporter ATP-binding protein [Cyclobacteriaceae bacterium]|nr:ABC transporter ATP-binding protein [Cyclobacteriaceae bacterium]